VLAYCKCWNRGPDGSTCPRCESGFAYQRRPKSLQLIGYIILGLVCGSLVGGAAGGLLGPPLGGGSGWDSCCRRRLSGTPVIQQGKWLDTSHRSPCAGSQRLRLANYDRQHGVDSHLETTAYVDVVQPPVAFKPSVRPLDAHPAVIDGLPLRCLRNLSHSLFMSWIRVDDRLG